LIEENRGNKATKKYLEIGVPIPTAVTRILHGEISVISAKAQNRKVSVMAAAVEAVVAAEGVVAEVVTAEAEGVTGTIEVDVEVTEAAEAAAVSAVETGAVAVDEVVP